MQPYFMPYIGYLSLIKHTDRFILFDTVQFIRHGWIERNRILKQNDGWLYIKVPLIKTSSRETTINNILIDNTQDWKSKILSQIQPYKKIAPNYYKVLQILNEIFKNDFNDIVSFNKKSLEIICEYLNIEKKIEIFSQINLEIEQANAPDEWALNICKKLKEFSDEEIHYINPIGGLDFFDVKKYDDANIKISFQKMNITEYDQKRPNFESSLSILDILMFNSIEEIHKMLDNFELI